MGYINFGRLVVLINRIDYFQVAYIIAKGTFKRCSRMASRPSSRASHASSPSFQIV